MDITSVSVAMYKAPGRLSMIQGMCDSASVE